MANPILAGFAGVTRFSGRDRRNRFWPYAGVVVVLTYLAMGLVGAAVLAPMFTEAAEFAAAHPEHATVTSGPGHYSVSIDADAPGAPGLPDLTPFFGAIGLGLIVAVALLAAAVSRRLHDTGRTALWGLAPLPFLAGALILMPLIIGEMTGRQAAPNLGLFLLLFLNNILYLASLLGLIILLCLQTKPGPNRYGEEPA